MSEDERDPDSEPTQPLGVPSYPQLPDHGDPRPVGSQRDQPAQQQQRQPGQWPQHPLPWPPPHPGGQPDRWPGPVAPGGPTRGSTPGWVWPVVAVTALVVGLLGGIVGGALVSVSMDGSRSIPVFDTDNGAAAPLEADNGSVAAEAAELLPSTVQVLARGGSDGQARGGATGSGFLLDDEGHVITNNHVVADATGSGELSVVDNRGREHAARIVGRSPVYDIAVLDVEGVAGLPPATLGSSSTMRVGATVVAIGSPLGLNSTVTSGIVSALDRPVTTGDREESSFINALQTDAAINPGNSGGPLVNMRGQVVGVNSAIATVGVTLGGEAGNIGVGFAIPMEQVQVTAAQILQTGRARYPVIGANVDTGSRDRGAQVVGVPAGTPAARAGLRKGDVVVGVDDTRITDGIGLIVAIRSHQPGERVTLTVQRGGKQQQIPIRLEGKVG